MASPRTDDAGDILIVDDTLENLVAFEAALEGLGSVVKVSSGRDALRLLLERDFALILLDVQMPGMDGIETAHLIRQRSRTRHVPIIFITAFDSDSAQVKEAYRLGAVDFLFKPVDTEVLRAKASVFVALQRRTAEVARQALQIKEQEATNRERALADQRRRLEADALRQSLLDHKEHASELAQKNRELEETKARLEKTNARLAEDDQRKDEFIALLAHELRNPLAAISTGLALLEQSLASDMEDVYRPMQRQCTHLVRLVDDLLEISRVTSGKLELRREVVSVGQILDDAAKLAGPEIERKKHELTVSCPCGDRELYGDPVRLAQMVGNLLSNAARYTDEGGRIHLSARVEDGVRISVEDNGRGIAPDIIDRVFDIFVQEESGGSGLGLGLTLVKQLAEKHDGGIAVRSDGPGKGSVFELTLPEKDGSAPAAPVANADAVKAQAADAPPEQLRVAIIDDNDDLRELFCSLLQVWGHTVTEAADGRTGLAHVRDVRPELVFIDVGLPDTSGHDIARTLRDELGDECPRLVALTGYGREKDRDEALTAGFDDHLTKPASAATLRSMIRR